MSNDERVTVVSDKGHRLQWATGLFYRSDGPKKVLNSSSLKKTSLVLFILASIALIFSPDDEPLLKSMFTDAPRESVDPKRIELEHYDKTLELESERAQRQSLRSRPRQKITVSKLAIFKRNPNIKIPPGVEVKARLLTAATDGQVKVVLEEDLESFDEVFAEEGSTLLGSGASGEERLFVKFQKIIHLDGKVFEIKAEAYDLDDRTIGLKGQKLGRRALKYLATTGLHFVAGVSQGLQKTEVKDGVVVKKSSVKNALLQGAATAALGQSKEMMEALKNKQNIIHVKPGVRILIVFEGSGV